ncbi:DUF383-domain-containing protein [Clavulina sp. PMI_390]|nr:DUF383-domain-containing protein [Clavulina sp. PMI_390]
MSSPPAVKAQLRELLPFLRDPNQTVRYGAIEALAGHSAPGASGREIFFESSSGGLGNGKKDGVIADLKVLCRDSPEIAHEAFKMLVNLSDSALLSTHFAEPVFLAFLVSYIANPTSVMADLACMLLANATSLKPSATALTNLTIPLLPLPSAPPGGAPYYPPLSRCGSAVPQNPYPEGSPVSESALAVLVDAFVRSAVVSTEETEDGGKTVTRGDPRRKADLHFLASVFVNISGSQPGRDFFITPISSVPLASAPPYEYPLAKLTAFTEHPSNIRRKGVAATIRNCAFSTAAHKAMLASDREMVRLVTAPAGNPEAPGINALPAILLPLTGPEEFDLDDMELMPPELQLLPPTKRRDPDPSIRLSHIETLLLFCTTSRGRTILRQNGVYPVIKAAHLAEDEAENVNESEESGVGEAIVRLVNLLKRDEGEETEGDGDEWWVAKVAEAADGDNEDDDEDDDKIVEIM